ncbi:sensor histidine kinase [Streptomyces griseorubiginosus]|uniref:sensor histidine kinase n=1 Tax=Streptomyces griseorubiginosus TaxID=67304 RepID=UPI0036E95306
MTATTRIRRLRWWLTTMFAATTAIGLVTLTLFAVRHDDAAWRAATDDDLRVQTSLVISVIGFSDPSRPDIGDLVNGFDASCPQVTVFSRAGAELAATRAAGIHCPKVREANLRGVAAAAIKDGDAKGDGQTEDGHHVRLRAEAFPGLDGDEPGGTVVAAVDTTTDEAQYRRFAFLLSVGCALLVLLSIPIGHLLSGRATRPALTALQQQEAFLAEAAHDLRTPAASLRTLAEIALHQHGEDRDAALRRTVRLATRMGDLLDALLTRARLEAGVAQVCREPLRFDQLVEAVVDDTPADGHRITVRAEETVVVGDSELLQRAVANLLGNALTHGHAPGRPAEVDITVTADGMLTLDDAGPGIPPGLADSLFKRYHSGGGSTGLGLSIASWIADAHGGTLTSGPSLLGGARFTLRIPARQRPKQGWL